MKHTIQDIRFYRALSSISKPIADSTHTISKIAFYVLELVTDSGVRGQGYLLSFHYSPNAVGGAFRDLCRFVSERSYSVFESPRIRAEWDMESEYFGNTGINNCVMAALSTALWDAAGRALDVPVWKLFGVCHKKIPVYGSGGWLSYSLPELIEEVTDYKKRGFSAVKIKVGSGSVQNDLERLIKCREALGPDVKIMMDANQGLTVPEALELACQAKSVGICWFEEPISRQDYQGYEFIRHNCGISIAMGEREYDTEGLKQLIARNAIDLWQPDIVRLGGVEAWKASASLAEAYGLPVLPHYYKDYDVPLLCSVRYPYGAESFDWIDGIIDNSMRIEEGFAYPRQGAGWGFYFKEDCLELIH